MTRSLLSLAAFVLVWKSCAWFKYSSPRFLISKSLFLALIYRELWPVPLRFLCVQFVTMRPPYPLPSLLISPSLSPPFPLPSPLLLSPLPSLSPPLSFSLPSLNSPLPSPSLSPPSLPFSPSLSSFIFFSLPFLLPSRSLLPSLPFSPSLSPLPPVLSFPLPSLPPVLSFPLPSLPPVLSFPLPSLPPVLSFPLPSLPPVLSFPLLSLPPSPAPFLSSFFSLPPLFFSPLALSLSPPPLPFQILLWGTVDAEITVPSPLRKPRDVKSNGEHPPAIDWPKPSVTGITLF